MITATFAGHGNFNIRQPLSLRARAVALLKLWVGRSRGRESLRELDGRLLQDIGIRREDALYESRKPFWRA